MEVAQKRKKSFCWHGSDDALAQCIERSSYVQRVRKELKEKKLKKINHK